MLIMDPMGNTMERPDSDKVKPTRAGGWRGKILGVIAITLVGWAFCYFTFTQGLSRFSYDFPMLLEPETVPHEAVIVYMDDKSRTNFNQPLEGLWDRALHARLLKRLTYLHARAVAFDVLMDRTWTNAVVDQEFAEAITNAITNHVDVVLGAVLDSQLQEGGGAELLQPVNPIGSAAPWGEAGLLCLPLFPGDMEMDHVVRSTGLLLELYQLGVADGGHPRPGSARPRQGALD